MAHCARRVVCSLLLFPILANGQGRYTVGETSSLGAGVGLGLAENTTNLNLNVNSSLAGVIDVGFGLTLGNIDDDAYGEDIGATEFGVGIVLRPTRPTPELPLLVELGLGVSRANLSADTFDDYGIDLSGTGWTLSLGIGAQLEAGPNLLFVPMITAARVEGTAKAESQFGDTFKSEFDNTAIGISFGLVFRNEEQSVVLSPGVSRSDGSTGYGLSVAVVFSEKPPKRATTRRRDEPLSDWVPEAGPARRPSRNTPETAAVHQAPDPIRWVAPATLAVVTAAIGPWEDVAAEQLTEEVREALEQLFEMPMQSLSSLRHGESAAPQGHSHHGALWFTVSVEDDSYSGKVTLIVSPEGRVIEVKSR